MNPISGIPDHLTWEQKSGVENRTSLGKDDFMTLLVTQLQNQDPLNPMEHQEFASQLAQFGTLEKLTNIETGVNGFSKGQNKESRMQAFSMIGKEIKAAGRTIDLAGNSPVRIAHGFEDGSRPTSAVIMDGRGTVVRRMDLGSVGLTQDNFVWDGKDDSGNRLPPASYQVRIAGIDKDGKALGGNGGIEGRVIGVEVQGSKSRLVVQTAGGRQRVDVSRVSSVMVPETKTAPSKNQNLASAIANTIQESTNESENTQDRRAFRFDNFSSQDRFGR